MNIFGTNNPHISWVISWFGTGNLGKYTDPEVTFFEHYDTFVYLVVVIRSSAFCCMTCVTTTPPSIPPDYKLLTNFFVSSLFTSV